ncbi:MAG TPA: DMT family transporter [Amycolatopsis sp.]|nr:DMT family transporter [Amycolatopsis sp.]
MGETKTLLRIAALATTWGSSFLWIKVGLRAFTPMQLVLIRVLLGALVLLVVCGARRDRLPSRKRTWLHLGVAAVFHNLVPFSLFAIGEETVGSGIAGVLSSTPPLWTLLATIALGIDRRLDPPRLLGLALGLAGTVLIFAPWQATGLVSWGALACLGAAASYGFVYVYEGRFLSDTGSSPVALAGGQMLAASMLMLLTLPWEGPVPAHPEPVAVIAAIVLGVVSTGITFAVSYQLLTSEGAIATSTVGYLLPVVSVLLGTVFLSEEFSPRVFAGMVTVLGGVALTRLRRWNTGKIRNRPESDEPPV